MNNMDYKCECGGKIIFESKKTFVFPDVKNGVCTKCHTKYVLKDNSKLIKKDGSKNAY